MILEPIKSNSLNSTTLATITAARKLGHPTTGIVFSVSNLDTSMFKNSGLDSILHISSKQTEHFFPEYISPIIKSISDKYTHIVAANTSHGKGVIPRLGALLNASPISDVIQIESSDTFIRSIYAGNAICKVKSLDDIKLITIRTSSFSISLPDSSPQIKQIECPTVHTNASVKWIEEKSEKKDRPSLSNAQIVISGGRGLKSAENFKLVFELADRLNAAVGASRAAVDAGYVPNELQVGQTGVIVAPKLYFAIGISGAIQHLAGMKDSRVIVAINKDQDAPIFQIADYGLVGDLFKILPELTRKLSFKE